MLAMGSGEARFGIARGVETRGATCARPAGGREPESSRAFFAVGAIEARIDLPGRAARRKDG